MCFYYYNPHQPPNYFIAFLWVHSKDKKLTHLLPQPNFFVHSNGIVCHLEAQAFALFCKIYCYSVLLFKPLFIIMASRPNYFDFNFRCIRHQKQHIFSVEVPLDVGLFGRYFQLFRHFLTCQHGCFFNL